MLPRLKDVLDLLERVAPLRLAEDWDNPGLQVGDPSQEIRKIFIALDPTLKALRQSAAGGSQLLLTHHPLIFRPLSRLDPKVYPGDVIWEAVIKGIAVVAAHTNLDIAPGGINDALASLFELDGVEVLEEKKDYGIPGAGLGRIGNLKQSMTLPALVEAAKTIFGVRNIWGLAGKKSHIRRVAVVGGAGGDMAAAASRMGADVLLTGDISHHEALEAQNYELALIDGGHFYTEKAALGPIKDRIEIMMRELGWDVIMEIFEDENAPMGSA